MTDKYIAPYIPFAVVDPQTGRATGQFQAFWKSGLEGAEAAAESAAAAALAAATAQTAADTAQGTAEAAQTTADTKQPQSASLDALAALGGTGLIEQTGPNAFTERAIGVGGASSIPTRADADGRYVQQNGTPAPSYSAYGGQTVSAAYVQAEAQATDNAIKAASAALVSLISKLHAVGVLS